MLLLSLICIPFIFGLLCWPFEKIIASWIPRWISLFSMIIVLMISLWLWINNYYVGFGMISAAVKNNISQWILEYRCTWIPRFGISFYLALDGLSLLMVVLSSFLGCIAVLCSWNEIRYHQGFFYCNLLWMLGSVVGVFLAIDMFLFFLFWEIMLIPTYFLISLWGNKKKNRNFLCTHAATKFFLYNQFGGLCMLISIITLVLINYNYNGVWSFSYHDLLCINLSKTVEYLLMLGFFLAFAIKMPIVPFHGWLPDAHSCAPTAGSVDLSGILLKTAAYGFLRFTLPLFPFSSQSFASIAMCLSILNIFYGAYMALAQTNMKRLIAYTNISHMGFILLAIYSSNHMAYQGAVVQMIAHSLCASGMFVLCGQLYERLNTQNIYLMGGLWDRINLMPAFSLCFSVAMLGLPGTGNFIGEISILLGSFKIAPIITIIAAFGIVFTSIYSLIIVQRVYYGSVSESFNVLLKKMTLREKFISIVLLLCLFLLGFFPQLIFNTSHISTKSICSKLQEIGYLK